MLDLYTLKNRYGVRGTLYQRGQYSPNYTTGQNTSNVQSICLRVIKLERNAIFQQLLRSLVNTAIRPDAIYAETEDFLIDIADLPAGWTVGNRDWIVINSSGSRYEVEEPKVIEAFNFIYIKAKRMQGPVERVINANVVDYIKISGVTS